jgi:hypothetical protein
MNPIVTVTGFGTVRDQDSRVPAEFAICRRDHPGRLGNLQRDQTNRGSRAQICQFDALAERAASKKFDRGDSSVAFRDSRSLGFWFLFLIAIVTTLETLNLSGATDTLHTIYLYIPKIVAALVTLILGLYFANFLESVTRTSCANAGLEQAASIGRAAYIGTAIFVVAGIFEILDIASEIVIWAFILVFGAVCLALSLAFGLGGRDVAGRYLEKWLEQKKNE